MEKITSQEIEKNMGNFILTPSGDLYGGCNGTKYETKGFDFYLPEGYIETGRCYDWRSDVVGIKLKKVN